MQADARPASGTSSPHQAPAAHSWIGRARPPRAAFRPLTRLGRSLALPCGGFAPEHPGFIALWPPAPPMLHRWLRCRRPQCGKSHASTSSPCSEPVEGQGVWGTGPPGSRDQRSRTVLACRILVRQRGCAVVPARSGAESRAVVVICVRPGAGGSLEMIAVCPKCGGKRIEMGLCRERRRCSGGVLRAFRRVTLFRSPLLNLFVPQRVMVLCPLGAHVA